MKINALNEAALAAAASLAATKAERGGAPAGTGAPEAAGSGVPVTVSAAARSLDVSSAGSGSGIDEAKVAAVKAAIANGTFTVNPGAIADKLLANAQEVLSRVRN